MPRKGPSPRRIKAHREVIALYEEKKKELGPLACKVAKSVFTEYISAETEY
jgi:hypothetical protein